MDEQELQQPVGGLGSQTPAPVEPPMEPEAVEAPKVTAIAPPAKTSEASQLDKSLDDYQRQKLLLNQQMQKMVDSYSERQQNQLFDPKMMAFAQGVLTPGKTGSFFESLGTGLGAYKDEASATESYSLRQWDLSLATVHTLRPSEGACSRRQNLRGSSH
jgi:hypothetical protein